MDSTAVYETARAGSTPARDTVRCPVGVPEARFPPKEQAAGSIPARGTEALALDRRVGL